MGLIDRLKSQIAQLRAKLAATLPGDAALGPPPVITTTERGIEIRSISDPALIVGVRHAVEAFCRKSGLDEAGCDDMGLCVNEALANVIRHAYSGAIDKPVEITAESIEGGGAKVSIRDWGNGYDPSHLMHREHDPLTPGGIGLICMKRMMDEVTYQPQADGMLLTMARKVGHQTEASVCAE